MRDLTGKRFGRLIALQTAQRPDGKKTPGAYWLCRCDCGGSKVVSGQHLVTGKTQSCGCMVKKRSHYKMRNNHPNKPPDVTWEIIQRAAPTKTNSGRYLWLCRCKACGCERILASNNLNIGTRCYCQPTRDGRARVSTGNCAHPRLWYNAKRNNWVVMDGKKHLLTSKDKAKAEAYLEQLLQQQKED